MSDASPAIVFHCPGCGARYKTKQRPQAGREVTCQKCQVVFIPAQILAAIEAIPSNQASDSHTLTTETPNAPQDSPAPSVQEQTPDFTPPLFVAEDVRLTETLEKRLARKKVGRKSSSFPISLVVMLSTALLGIGGALTYWVIYATNNSQVNTPAVVNTPVVRQQTAPPSSPTPLVKREPITLTGMPAGVRLILMLRVEDLLSDNLDPISTAAIDYVLDQGLRAQLEALTFRPLTQIDTLLIGFLFGPVGSPADTAVRVELKPQAQGFDPETEMNAQRRLPEQQRLSFINDRAIFVSNAHRYTIAPQKYAPDLVNFEDQPAFTDRDLEAALKRTDKNQLITTCGLIGDLPIHAQSLSTNELEGHVIKSLGAMAQSIATTFSWEANLQNDFQMALEVTPAANISAVNVSKQIKTQTSKLPIVLMDYLRKHSASQHGTRQLAGRVPAMIQTVLLETDFATRENRLQLSTSLPAKAGPNLLLGSYACLQSQSRLMATTNVVQTTTPKTSSPTANSPSKTWQQKLATPVEVDFRRTPLQEAIAFLAEESKLSLEIDGDGLKLAGYTKNMPQSFQLGKIPVAQALQAIMAQYDVMTIVLLNDQGDLLLTTQPAAESRQLKVISLTDILAQPADP